MKLFSSLMLSLCSVFGFSQTILYQAESTSRTVQDPQAVVMAQGFNAKGDVSNPFIAKIGPATENPGGGPINSNAGANNPSGTSAPTGKSFHDTQGNIEVTGTGQLQFTLPIALPPGVKNVVPQANLVYTSGTGNGIAGYSWNLSGITSISRVGKNHEKDGEIKGVQLDYSDYYSFNGQRLILKSGEYGKDGAEYITEKYSNIRIKSVGSYGLNGQDAGPAHFEVTFEDGSQAQYGANTAGFRGGQTVTTPLEYNIVKWKDAQGNHITYKYASESTPGGFRSLNRVMRISSIEWGGNETLNKPHFNSIEFIYIDRDLKEQSYVQGLEYNQNKILSEIIVTSHLQPFKTYRLAYKKDNNGTNYQFLDKVTEYNSANESANPVSFEYESSVRGTNWLQSTSHSLESGVLGDFDGDGKIDALEYKDQPFRTCESISGTGFNAVCVNPTTKPAGMYLARKALDGPQIVKELTFLGSLDITKDEFKKALPISFKDTSGNLENQQGFAFYKVANDTKDIQLFVYSINQNNQLVHQYTKVLPKSVYDLTTPEIDPMESGSSFKTTPLRLVELDLDGDGISELMMGFNDAVHTKVQKPQDPHGPISLPEFDETFQDRKRYIVINLDNTINTSQSYSQMSFYPYDTDIFEIYKIGDFDGDGKTDFLRFDSGNRAFIVQFQKGSNNLYSIIERGFYLNDERIKGVNKRAVVGDFNGDGKTDLLVPASDTTTDWYLYQSTGKSFIEEFKPGFALFRKDQLVNSNKDGTATVERTSHQAYDLDRDGKSDFVTFNYRKERVKLGGSLTIFNIYYYNTVDIKISAGEKKFNNDIRYAFNEGPLGDSSGFRDNPHTYLNERTKYDMQELLGNFKINQSVHQIILVSPNPIRGVSGDRVMRIDFYDVSKEARISSITQGGVKTDISYKELDPVASPNFYQAVKKEKYPFMELANVQQSYAVSQLQQEGKKQDFRYRGLLAHLQGRGTVGFRQTARSSWYADGLENTKIWNGVEIDPLNESLPIKEWSIRTTDETKVFPADISENNSQLLTFKSTIYQADKLINGQVTAVVSENDKSKTVTAIVPKIIKTKDFLTNTVAENTITYGNYYLPSQNITNINNGYAVTTSAFTYFHNPSGTGAEYYIGRPHEKTEIKQAYNDTKSSKEEYTYENNSVKTKKTWNRDNTGWLLENYNYDIFGNITQKTTTNSIDSQSQTVNTQFDEKGRFVVKKTDNLGLVTNIVYNNWGQITKQTDPLGNILENEYDTWGKLMKSKTSLGGTTTFEYIKDDQYNSIVVQHEPHGNTSKKYTNKFGQKYKASTKAFQQGQFLNIDIQYDALGRKTSESEPYAEGASAWQWNTIVYDDSVFPTKVTATAFTGKQMETSIVGGTTTEKELNGYTRTTSKTTDALGNVVSSTDKGGTITFSYNAVGEQIKAQYAENTVIIKYDSWGRKSELNDPSNGTYKYEYNGFGQTKKTISPKGTKEYTYNNLGQLTSQKELSTTDGGQATNKLISFGYDDKGRLISKTGTSKGKTYSSTTTFDQQGRVLSSSESSNDKYFIQKGITYDDKARIISYEKQLYSSGVLTKVQVENVYNPWNGDLYLVKDKNSGKTLWELKDVNARGQVLKAQLGAAEINQTYEPDGTLSQVNHGSAVKKHILRLSYNFNAVKNELETRTTEGDFYIAESFDYDDNNRLINWTNPVTGVKTQNAVLNVYDTKGRILENDQVGKIKFDNSSKIYQPTGMTLNAAGTQNYNNDLIQNIVYNENNDPVFIDGMKGDVAFQYGLTAMRQRVTYGGNFANDEDGKFTKYYSEDGSFEVVKDNATGKEKHILYIGGTPYESDIIYVKNYEEVSGSYKFLHKDYLGSILAISDEAGNKLEQRHFDAWGNMTHLQIANGPIISDINKIQETVNKGGLLLERGYTSHEHFMEVGIIHMNGRLYDPLLRRFLNADEHIQDPYDTQNYNKYGYVLNNPLMFNDPSGEFLQFLIPVLIKIAIGAAYGAIIGAGIGILAYTVKGLITKDWSGFGKAVLGGAIAGAISGGLNGLGAALFSPSSAILNNGTWELLSNITTQSMLEGKIDAITITSSMIGAFVGNKLPGWKGLSGKGVWGWTKNAVGEILYNSTKYGITGAISGGFTAMFRGTNVWQGIKSGFENGAYNGAGQAAFMITVFGATYKPTETQLQDVKSMSKELDISYKHVKWRNKGLYQLAQPFFAKLFTSNSRGYSINEFRREVTWGNNVATFGAEGALTHFTTFGHEFGHIFQVYIQGWTNFQVKGIWEQLFMKGDPYETFGTNEYNATQMFKIYRISKDE
ncbi:RHS repeat-associated core domain-containing protein [Chryseobacterium indologenes]|uniref:RHS repeat-associated core domain-containing protein n=1 Tax=Chryseobacterium indologenes TaxID=253 RepID=UPI0010245CCC|nr:RHS repeat-associated core domain-containing protein [Chryseobacterium indologenes]VFA43237.1 Cell wall-associated polypeptide CWBP200 [Chryseobacterium indologenes]